MTRCGAKGFTLLEITACVSIMSIVSALTVAGYNHAVFAARKNRAKAEILAIDGGLASFVAKRGREPLDLDGNGLVSERETIRQLREWGHLSSLELNADGLIVDPWGDPYVIVLRRDYDRRGAEVICDDYWNPFNSQSGGVQVYSKMVFDDVFVKDLRNFSNIEETEAYPGLPTVVYPPAPPGPPVPPPAPTVIDSELAAKLAKEADKAAECAGKYHDKAGCYASKGKIDKAVKYSGKAADYAQQAADLAEEAAYYDPLWSGKAAEYAQLAADYAADAQAYAAML